MPEKSGIPLLDMEKERKYKQRTLVSDSCGEKDPSLKRYEEGPKRELVVHRSSVLRASNICFTILKSIMAVFAFLGAVSLVRPDLRAILLEIIEEAVREISIFS